MVVATLAELLADLDSLDDDEDATIFTAIAPYASFDTLAVVVRPAHDGTVPAEAAGMGYFLEVSIAKEVASVWRNWRPGRHPTVRQLVEAIVHYAVNDAYLPVETQPLGETTTLYRPVGPEELQLIEDSGWTRFPPRLPEQPIFYPVLTEEYATTIARDWNVPASGVGFVTRFDVRNDYLAQHQIEEAGSRDHREYWIPAEDIDAFNAAIVGPIEVVSEWRKLDPSNDEAPGR